MSQSTCGPTMSRAAVTILFALSVLHRPCMTIMVKSSMADSDALLTAEVIVTPPHAAAEESVMSQNIREHMPEPEVIARGMSEFQRLGFTPDTPGPVGFSITAPPSTFEQVFRVKIEIMPGG